MKTACRLERLSSLLKLIAVLAVVLLPASASALENVGSGSKGGLADAIWSPTHFPVLVTQTKFAAENLLYDFGNQRFLTLAARKKGAPITLRLANVDVPNGIEGLSSELLFTRFFWFTRGHGDVKVGKNARSTDIDLSMRILPASGRGYALRVEARAARGKGKGKLLYSKTRPIQ